jgi:hypothetical protein
MDIPPRRRQTGLNYVWQFWPEMVINVLNVVVRIIFIFTIANHDDKMAPIKWTICKPYANNVISKPRPGGDRMVRVVSNPGEPDEGKLSSPVR